MIDSQISCNFMKQLKLSSLIVSINNIDNLLFIVPQHGGFINLEVVDLV